MSNEQKHGMPGCLFIFFAIVYTTIVAFFSLVCGGVLGTKQIYHRESSLKIRAISKVLESDPDRYSGLHVRKASQGRASIRGAVESQKDKDALTVEIINLYGGLEGCLTTMGVDIRPSGKVIGTENGGENVPEEKKQEDSLTEKKGVETGT